MIKFFRHIRQRMLKENRFSMPAGRLARYFLYAIGEIVLVVIGILIALQINMWNEGRKDRVKEQVVLHQLLEEFHANLEQLDAKIQAREVIIRASTQALGYMDHQEGVRLDSLMAKICPITITPTFDPINNDLVSSGNLRLIRNAHLNRLLTEWPIYVVQLREIEDEYVGNYRDHLMPTLLNIGIGRDVENALARDNSNYNWLLDKNDHAEKPSIGRSLRPVVISEVLNNKALEGLLANAIQLNHVGNLESRSLRLRITEILALLRQETSDQR